MQVFLHEGRKNDRYFPTEKWREKVEKTEFFPREGKVIYIFDIYYNFISLTVNGGKKAGVKLSPAVLLPRSVDKRNLT